MESVAVVGKGKSGKKPSLPPVELSGEQAETMISEYGKRRTYKINSYNKIVVIGDSHKPWCDPDALTMVYAIIEKEKPDVVVQIGDLMDMFAQSRFPRSLNIMTPREEIGLAKSQANEMWKKINSIVPNATKWQMVGNHCVRPLRQVIEKWPEGEDFVAKAFKDLYAFDGVTTIYDPREELYIGDIAFIHGYRSKLGDHSKYMLMNVVCGHSHRGGTFFHQVSGETKWELNAGYIADPFSAALSYRAQRLHDWTAGCGIIDSLGPRFVPFT
jgi:hypothetical protein